MHFAAWLWKRGTSQDDIQVLQVLVSAAEVGLQVLVHHTADIGDVVAHCEGLMQHIAADCYIVIYAQDSLSLDVCMQLTCSVSLVLTSNLRGPCKDRPSAACE